MNDKQELRFSTLLAHKNLEEIEKRLTLNVQAIPVLDKQNKKLFEMNMAALENLKKINFDYNMAKLQEAKLLAQRSHLDEVITGKLKGLNEKEKTIHDLIKMKKELENEYDKCLSDYDKKCEEIANKFRDAAKYYNEAYVNSIIGKSETHIQELNIVSEALDQEYAMSLEEYNGLQPKIPSNILDIMGKEELENEIEKLHIICQKLQLKHDELITENK